MVVSASLFGDPAERFAAELRAAEERLRACGLSGRRAFVALVRHLSDRLGLPRELWPDGADAPAAARLDQLPLAADLDLFGLAYERFFTDLFKGERGQYFTPRPLVELLADLAGVRPGDRVLDPTCGSGGFLIAALARGADVDGIEVDPDLATLARLNLAMHGQNPRSVKTADFFREPPDDRWDVVLANPPFSVVIDDPEVLARHGLRGRVGSDVLFVQAALACVRPGGRLATVLPYSFLTNPGTASVRDSLSQLAVREAVVSLPEGIFNPFGGTGTRACVVVLRRLPAPMSPMLAAIVQHPGFDTRRQTYRRTEPDELVGLRLHLRGAAFPAARRVNTPVWLPEECFDGSVIAASVETFRLSERVEVLPTVGVKSPEARSVIEFSHVDKQTGEVIDADARNAEGLAELHEGEILFGRMRPALNNVVRASVPRDDLPRGMAGSGEWVRLRPAAEGDFLLVALRSSFARAQLAVTSGQTRPRARIDDIAAMRLPDPGPDARAAIDAAVGALHRERAASRARLIAIAEAYEAFGRGEISAEELVLRVEGRSPSGPRPVE